MVHDTVEVITVAPNGVDAGGDPVGEVTDRCQPGTATCAFIGGADCTARSGTGVAVGMGGTRGVGTVGFHRD